VLEGRRLSGVIVNIEDRESFQESLKYVSEKSLVSTEPNKIIFRQLLNELFKNCKDEDDDDDMMDADADDEVIINDDYRKLAVIVTLGEINLKKNLLSKPEPEPAVGGGAASPAETPSSRRKSRRLLKNKKKSSKRSRKSKRRLKNKSGRRLKNKSRK
jgi:hypothetical protein